MTIGLQIEANNMPAAGSESWVEDTSGINSALSLSQDRVGIGTTSPATKLHIDAGAADTNIFIGNNVSYNNGIQFNTPGVGTRLIQDATTADFHIDGAWSSAWHNMIHIDNGSGNVGIGVTSPGAKLEIKAAEDGDGLAVYDSDGKAMLLIRDNHQTNRNATDFRSECGSMWVVPKSNDSVGIQDAIDYIMHNYGAESGPAYGIVYLPHERYTINSQIMIYEGISLIGSGVLSTILDASTWSVDVDDIIVSQAADYDTDHWNPKYNIVLKDFSIIGNTTNRDYKGIYLQGVAESLVENISVTGCKTGIHLKGWENTLKSCWVSACITGYDLSWPDEDHLDSTNATLMIGCHSAGGNADVPTSTIQSGSYSSGRVTISTSPNHRLQEGAEATISGCTIDSYNDTYRDVHIVSATQFTAVPLTKTPSGNASDGTVTGAVIGCFINGSVNNIQGCTIEKNANTTETLAETVAIYIQGQDGSTTYISGCYFEHWKTVFKLDNCYNVNIIGCHYQQFGTNPFIKYLNGSGNSDRGNNLYGNSLWIVTWSGGVWNWAISAGNWIALGSVGIGKTDPETPLHVVGAVTIENDGTINSFLSDKASPKIYSSNSSGSYPFNSNGNLIIQPRTSSGMIRDIIFATGPGTPVARQVITSDGSIGINTTDQFGGGVGVIGIANATTVPSGTAPSGGGVLFVQNGALKYKGSGGTVTTIANA